MKDTGVYHLPVIADLDITQTKVTGKASGVKDNLQILKVRAVNNALATSNADVLLEPRFAIEATSSRTTVTVTGFPANYKNFRTITEKDASLIDNTGKLLQSSKFINE